MERLKSASYDESVSYMYGICDELSTTTLEISRTLQVQQAHNG